MTRIKSGTLSALAVTGAILFAYACSSGGSSGGNTHPDASTTQTGAVCGDGICAATEIHSCPVDCGNGSGSGSSNVNPVCGNGICESGENASTCPGDCGQGSGNGSGSASCDMNTILACIECLGGGTCTGVDMNTCDACLGLGGLTGCDGGLPDGVCESDENSTTCPFDCP